MTRRHIHQALLQRATTSTTRRRHFVVTLSNSLRQVVATNGCGLGHSKEEKEVREVESLGGPSLRGRGMVLGLGSNTGHGLGSFGNTARREGYSEPKCTRCTRCTLSACRACRPCRVHAVPAVHAESVHTVQCVQAIHSEPDGWIPIEGLVYIRPASCLRENSSPGRTQSSTRTPVLQSVKPHEPSIFCVKILARNSFCLLTKGYRFKYYETTELEHR